LHTTVGEVICYFTLNYLQVNSLRTKNDASLGLWRHVVVWCFFITFSYILVESVAFLDSLELKKARNYMVLISQHRGTISINETWFLVQNEKLLLTCKLWHNLQHPDTIVGLQNTVYKSQTRFQGKGSEFFRSRRLIWSWGLKKHWWLAIQLIVNPVLNFWDLED